MSPSISLRAFCTAVPASPLGRILDDEFDRAAEDAALAVDLVERHLAADQFVLAGGGVGAGQRIVEADLDRVGGAGADDERTGELGGGERRRRFDKSAAVDAGAPIGLGQASLPSWTDFVRPACGASDLTIRYVLWSRGTLYFCAYAVKRAAQLQIA